MTALRLEVPEKPTLEGLETRWQQRWEADGVYRFDRLATRSNVYAIDTPPLTVSGSLHVGHIFSFTQTDIVARFQRMSGREVFYPIGWDDNGLPTERRVQNFYSVRCDPSVPYDPHFVPPREEQKEPVRISRPNFVELCHELAAEDERAFEESFRRLGLSVDWTTKYTTIGDDARRISQRAFLRMLARDESYRQEAPTLWDVDFNTAVAQAELADREVESAYHRVVFARADHSGSVEIETTRPELIPACVALVAHPDDARYQALFGTSVRTPLFSVEVPVLAHSLAEPDKGSGIAMICTFGDLTDVTWWRELHLPTRTIIGRDGRLEPIEFSSEAFPSTDPLNAEIAYRELEGKTARQAQRRIVELLGEANLLVGEPRRITHAVKFYENGTRPLEIVSSRQWYVRTMALRPELLQAGRKVSWHPEFMRARYESWVEGLTGDWNISRQRYFGVPFPVWYAIAEDGSVDEDQMLLPDEEMLPVDPSTDVPPGYAPSSRGEPGGFVGDADVMDTWATSSLTPEIAGHWDSDPDLFSRIYPMDLRPQAHEIIRTWLFSTMVRSHLEHGDVPWGHAAISGWVLDPDRKKMSKSKGNVVVPTELLDKHGTDAVRYWAGSARLGVDTVFDEQQMQVGRRLAIKILNASKFALGIVAGAPDESGGLFPLDAAMLGRLAEVVDDATRAFANYDHARALERTEQFFWAFCDDYLELVKARAYGGGNGGASASRALAAALSVILRLFAPFLPFVTEEIWSWWQEGSIHRAPWPVRTEILELGTAVDGGLLDHAAIVLGEVRRAKTSAKLSLRAPVARVSVAGPSTALALLESARQDLVNAGGIGELVLGGDTGELTVEVSM